MRFVPAKDEGACPALTRQSKPEGSGFTLIELLVVIAVIALLAAMLLPSMSKAKSAAVSSHCLSQLHQIAIAIRLYADTHHDEFPRSQHSAFTAKQQPWGRAIAAELSRNELNWTNNLKGIYHCPADNRKEQWSYGLNVYFELNPVSDDYAGSPQTWRRMSQVPKPAATILMAENEGDADHIMPHFWTSERDAADVAKRRHRQRSNYSFVDGHALSLPFPKTYATRPMVDLWNPSLAP